MAILDLVSSFLACREVPEDREFCRFFQVFVDSSKGFALQNLSRIGISMVSKLGASKRLRHFGMLQHGLF